MNIYKKLKKDGVKVYFKIFKLYKIYHFKRFIQEKIINKWLNNIVIIITISNLNH